ncbi:hypothetical protein NBRC10512_005038 [Rhodotorula toruloides]|uniref:Proteophosphoglycan ppg4 n=1 Tax=Rhodotorula toruloides (strain NP11) TaxID=1130832 RepID=M7X2R2_RHOT1|nr:uncharacterized protein RHTO_04573 [Rhodotorula toruloides NP11]EMS24395.1 hypothetical protein RHTO_04573 [Rhodotorula toruloides NP11]
MAATLPQDVLEIVFRYVEQDPHQIGRGGKKLSKREAARQSFHRLCLVSRVFCHVGRRFLYRKPLFGRHLAPKALFQLAETLRANQRYLGKLVTSLSGADTACERLGLAEETLGPTSLQFRGFSKAFSWQLFIFSSCPNCREVTATYSAESELKKLVRIVSTSLPDLRRIRLVDSSSGRDAIRAAKLSIVDPEASLLSLHSFFPIDTSRLTDLALRYCAASEPDLLKLVMLAPQLVKLSLKSSSFDPDNHLLWQYATDVEGSRLPTKFFALLPNIVRLELGGLAALSVWRLQLLAKHSPRIRHLSTEDCVWLRDEGASAVFPTNDLAEVFPTFKRLKYAHIGTIPFGYSNTLVKPIEKAFKKMRAKLAFEFADDVCPNCGRRHF